MNNLTKITLISLIATAACLTLKCDMPESAISGSCMTKDECSFYEMFLKEGGFMNWKISKTLQQRAEACADSEEPTICCATNEIKIEETKSHENPVQHKNKKLLSESCEVAPTIVIIYSKNVTGDFEIVCTGTLITNQYILAPAHCDIPDDYNSELFVSFTLNGEMQEIDKIVQHPGFNGRYLLNDIAIYKLHQSVDLDKFQVACIPFHQEFFSMSLTKYQIFGYELFEYLGRKSFEMAQRNVFHLSEMFCNNFISRNRFTASIDYQRSFCYKGLDYQIPGSAVVVESDEKIYQIGFISRRTWHTIDSPGVAVKISSYINWILDNLDDDDAFELNEMDVRINAPSCGQRKISDFLISYGTEALLSEFPWNVLLGYDDKVVPFKCGGSLITQKFVLTAGHCLLKTPIFIRLGEHNLNTTDDCVSCGTLTFCNDPIQDIVIDYTLIHHDFDYIAAKNDIALIKMKAAAHAQQSNINTICLPSLTEKIIFPRNFIISGFGATENSVQSIFMNKATVSIMPRRQCPKKNRQYFCAGGKDRIDSCAGDSGMGIIQQIDMKMFQFGLVSHGNRICGAEGSFGVYLNIFNYISWIKSNIS